MLTFIFILPSLHTVQFSIIAEKDFESEKFDRNYVNTINWPYVLLISKQGSTVDSGY